MRYVYIIADVAYLWIMASLISYATFEISEEHLFVGTRQLAAFTVFVIARSSRPSSDHASDYACMIVECFGILSLWRFITARLANGDLEFSWIFIGNLMAIARHMISKS